MTLLPDIMWVNIAVLAACFYALARGANLLVDGSVGIAFRLHIPKVIIGIVLVSFGTTMPEFTVSVISALQDHSEIALGNAVGSVIVNVAIALALGVLLAPKILELDRSVYRTVGLIFLIAVIVTFFLAIDGVVGRIEGGILILLLCAYLSYLLVTEKRRYSREFEREAVEELSDHPTEGSLGKFVLLFALGLGVVIVASRLLVESAVNIAERLAISETIVGLTIIAIGTSLPEVATAIVATRKGHGDLAFGDVMGANILNLLWIVGGASLARPIEVTQTEIFFMFPSMVGVVGLMFLLARFGYMLNKWKSVILLLSYVVYVILTIVIFVPT
jgi:cation:H+ antiporter